MSGDIRVDRILEIFYRALKGEALSAARLADAVDVGLVIIDRINSISLSEQACLYDGLLRYAETSGVPIISLRQFLFQKDDREFVIGGISRWLVDRMLEKTNNTIEL